MGLRSPLLAGRADVLLHQQPERLAVSPARPLTVEELHRKLSSPGNGLRDVYQVPAAALDLRSPCP
jgi:hypothetical protein